MVIRIEKLAESELNMTPMIDIVFQLILFFLFNLRFKSQEYRIESALPKEGIEPTPRVLEPQPRIKVALFREHPESAERAVTKIRLGGTDFLLPRGTAPTKERDAVLERLRARIVSLHAETGWPGEIQTPLPSGPFVPHADVVSVVDAFLAANVNDIGFEGTKSPLPTR
jgi:hypothetical protein